jgi:hypothetical protein
MVSTPSGTENSGDILQPQHYWRFGDQRAVYNRQLVIHHGGMLAGHSVVHHSLVELLGCRSSIYRFYQIMMVLIGQGYIRAVIYSLGFAQQLGPECRQRGQIHSQACSYSVLDHLQPLQN